MWQNNPAIWLLLLASAISLTLALFAWRHRSAAGAVPLVFLALGAAIWQFGYAVELAWDNQSVKVVWAKLEYLGIASIPTFWFAVALQYSGLSKWLTRRNLVLMAVVPVITLVLAWTNEAHGLIWSSITPDTSGDIFVLVFGHGAWFWFYTGYAYLLLLSGMIAVASTLFSTPAIYGKQALAWLVATITPWAANWLFSVGLTPLSNLNLTPFAFIISSLTVAWAIFRAGLFSITPLARNAIVEEMANGVLVLDTRDRVVDYNLAVQKILGASSPLAVGHPIEEVWPHAFELLQSSAGRQGESLEFTSGASGSRHTYEVNISALFDGRRQAIGRAIIFNEITERKQAEEALRESEEQYRAIVENVGDAISINVDAKRVFVNKAFLDIFGLKDASEVIGKPMGHFIISEDREEVVERVLARQRGDQMPTTFETRIVRPDGEVRDIQAHATALLYKGQMANLAVIRDITESKRAEERIEGLLRYNRLILNSAGEGICGLDMEGKITFANPAVIRMLGWTAEEIIDRTLHDISHHSKADGTPYPREECPIQATLRDGAINHVVDEVFWRKDGSYLHVDYICTPVRDEEGNLEGAVVTLRDTTERLRAQKALEERERLYQTLFENTPVGTGIADIAGNLIDYNSAMLEPGGYTREDMAKIGNVGHLYADAGERDRVLALARKQGFVLRQEVKFKRKDGTSYDTLLSLTPVIVQGEQGWQAVVEDITERKRAEDERTRHARELREAFDNLKDTQQQLIQSAKLAAIGELVSGIAHELNNPLASVLGMSQLIMKMDLDESLKEDVEIIRYEAERAAKIVQSLLSFARKHQPEKRRGSVNEALGRALELRGYDMQMDDVEIELNLQPDLPETWFDFYQMQQVFLNIIINAEQAMSEVSAIGRLCIRTQRVDEKIHISVADNGPGIPNENLHRIFDPFFTTKEVGKGTGLGLSLSYGIVQEHGGRIWVESEVGKGSTFTVELPITRE